MSEETITFPDAVLKIAGQYARRRRMPSGTIARYESGEANDEPIVQVIGQAYLAGQRDPLPDQYVEQVPELAISTETVGGLTTLNEGTIITGSSAVYDHYKQLLEEVESLNNRIATSETENTQLKNQLADAGGEVVVLKTTLAEKELHLATMEAGYQDGAIKLTNKLVSTQTVISKIKARLEGSWFGKIKDIKNIVDGVDISNR